MSEFRYMISILFAMVMIAWFAIAFICTADFTYVILAFCALIYGEIIDLKYKK